MEEEQALVSDRDHVVVEHAAIDDVGRLLHEERDVVAQAVQSSDRA